MLSKQVFDFQMKTKTKFGPGIFKKLPEIINDLGFRRVGIVIDPAVYKNEKAKKILDDCAEKYKTSTHIYKLKGEPSYDYLDQTKPEFMENGKSKVDCFVGIGGGSCMDFAKGLSTLVVNEGLSIEYRGFPKGINPSLPMIAVPTTSGTGSELAYNAVFVETKEKKKLGINTESNYPIMAILDPELTLTCPERVTISSGLDTLVHALESFVSRKANFMSRFYSKEAFNLIINNLPRVIDKPDDIEARSQMMIAAYWAMAALSNSSSGPAGALSYLLGAQYNTPHGIAGGVFVGRITRINHDLGYYEYSELFDAISDKNAAKKLTQRDKSQAVVIKIEKLLGDLKVPRHLSCFGVKKEDYDLFYKHATEIYKAAFDLNPVFIKEKEIAEMLKEMIL